MNRYKLHESKSPIEWDKRFCIGARVAIRGLTGTIIDNPFQLSPGEVHVNWDWTTSRTDWGRHHINELELLP
jgi:hypothetical protein